MENSFEFVILKKFPEIVGKLGFYNSQWIKVNQGSNRAIPEWHAKNLVEKYFPTFFNEHILDELKKELERHHLQNKADIAQKRESLGWGTYANELEFIVDMNRRHQLFEVNASGSVHELNGRSMLLPKLKVLAYKYMNETHSKLEVKNIADSLSVIIDQLAFEKKEQIRNKIAFDPSTPDRFDDLMDAMRITENREIQKNAIKHYLWQIKRKLWGHEPAYHFMLILFTNRQAFGKSWFLRQFHTPISEVYANITGDRIRDQFGADLFESYFVACFDELAQLGKTDINLLKEFVTRKNSVQRIMYSQVTKVNNQNATLCGTTNRPINQIIYDPSGMRRWWQIDLNSKDHDTMDFEKMNHWASQEFLDFWKAIDESEENGFYGRGLPLYEEMVIHQDSYKAVSPIQQFVDDFGYTQEYSKKGNDHLERDEVELEDVWQKWLGWCKGTRNTTYSSQAFKNGLQELGFQISEHRPINKTTGQRGRVHYLVVDKVKEEDEV